MSRTQGASAVALGAVVVVYAFGAAVHPVLFLGETIGRRAVDNPVAYVVDQLVILCGVGLAAVGLYAAVTGRLAGRGN
jgi:hypothetical protein